MHNLGYDFQVVPVLHCEKLTVVFVTDPATFLDEYIL